MLRSSSHAFVPAGRLEDVMSRGRTTGLPSFSASKTGTLR
jgi:hypothetical protein